MITFDNLCLSGQSKPVDITIPNASIVFLNGENARNLFTKTPHFGQILYQNFPISFAQKTFFTKIFLNTANIMLAKNLTLLENMQVFSELFGVNEACNLPLVYFEIPRNLWNVRAKNLDFETRISAIFGLSLIFQGQICMFEVPKNITEKTTQKLENIMISRANHGNCASFYFGQNLGIEKELKIFLDK